MTEEEADEIVCEYEFWDDISCSCHCGNPPCSKCERMPSEEDYKQSLKMLEDK